MAFPEGFWGFCPIVKPSSFLQGRVQKERIAETETVKNYISKDSTCLKLIMLVP